MGLTDEGNSYICKNCFIRRNEEVWLIRRKSKKGSLYWSNSDLSTHFSKRPMYDGSGDVWCHHANRRELALFQKDGPNAMIFTKYKDGNL